jgi:bifunctional non-homologous end joining protein LigD
MKIQAMNAKIGTLDYLNKSGYIYEPKLDGYRALCYVNREIAFISRNNNDITKNFPDLRFRKKIKAKSAILDGEIVAYDKNGNPSFSLLQQGHDISYVVFDILMKDGIDLTNKPLLERKKILADTVRDKGTLEVMFYTSDGKALWHEVKKRNLEGVIAKKSDALYYPGKRTDAWLKIKLLNTIDCVIVGYMRGKRIVSSLALGLYNDAGELTYIGNVGTGFTMQMIQELYNKLKPLERSDLAIKNKDRAPKNLIWVKPKLIAEVKYLEMTSFGIVRASVFLRLRDDKKPKDCAFKDQFN